MSIYTSKANSASKYVIGAGVLLIGSLAFSGCAAGPEILPTPSATKSETGKATPTQSTVPSVTATSSAFALRAEITDKSCESILNLQSLYDFDPNVALTPGGTPVSGSIAQTQSQLGGISCTVTNLSSQQEVLVTVVKLDQSSAEHQKAEISSATGTNSFQVARDVPGSFVDANGSGSAQFITGKYWVSLSSTSFKIGVDASPLSYVVWNNLQ